MVGRLARVSRHSAKKSHCESIEKINHLLQRPLALERRQFLCYDDKNGGRVGKGFPETTTQNSARNQRDARKAPLYKVLMHNDDYTSMEFVVEVLESVFHKSPTEANQIMLNVHFRGVGICGIYTHEIAETRISRVHSMARSAGFPLRCSMEQE